MRAALASRLRQVHADDGGTSLVELVVGMMVMVIFMAIFTGAIVSMAKTTTKVEAVTSSASQVNNAFLRLDKLVRYADAITTIGTGTGGDWYVELDSVNYVGSTETHQCTQLRVDTTNQQLRLRTWNPLTATTYDTLSTWTTLASKITNGAAAAGSADAPFRVPAALAAASTSYQRLTVTLVAGTAGASSTSTTRSVMTFTALNSVASNPTNSAQCQQLAAGGLRP